MRTFAGTVCLGGAFLLCFSVWLLHVPVCNNTDSLVYV